MDKATTRLQERHLGKLKIALRRVTNIISVGVVFAAAPGLMAAREDQAVPLAITPPSGNVLFLTTQGIGTQNYICLPSATGSGSTWVFFSPQATLSVGLAGRFKQPVVTHFLSPVPGESTMAQPGCTLSSETDEVDCPTWQSSFDSSAVWGSKVGSITAGSDASCANAGAIPCLLLKALSTRRGLYGFGLLTKTSYIQRLNTSGGAAPTSSCKVGDQALVPYQATYLFYTAESENFVTDEQHY